MLYLASPYSHPSPGVEEARFGAAFDFTSKALTLGFDVFSPIVYGRAFHAAGVMRGDFQAWITFNEGMMRGANGFWILCLEGWEKSKGITHEMDFMWANRKLRPHYFYNVADLYSYAGSLHANL